MKLALTGAPGSGKTTLCERLVDAMDLHIGGIPTREIRGSTGHRTGFAIRNIATGTEGLLASVDRDHGPRVGKYRVHLDDLERVAIPAIAHAIEGADLLIVDEVAPMELKSDAFVEVTERALSSPRPVLVTFKGRRNHPWVEKIRQYCEVHELTVATRDRVYQSLSERLSNL